MISMSAQPSVMRMLNPRPVDTQPVVAAAA